MRLKDFEKLRDAYAKQMYHCGWHDAAKEIRNSTPSDLGIEIVPESVFEDAERYHTARRMNVQQWKEAWTLNISTGKPFDEIIDDLKPFKGAAIDAAMKK